MSPSPLRRGLQLECATLLWNVLGTPVMMATGAAASSTALVGFGLDSLIEIFASVVVIWQLRGDNPERERQAMKLIGSAFLLLAVYIFVQSSLTLATALRPLPSPVGVAWLAATFAAMLLLAWGKLVTGRQLGNAVLSAEARVTLIDAALAGTVLLGVGLNTVCGWWWADPVAALVMVYYGFKEGVAAWRHAMSGT